MPKDYTFAGIQKCSVHGQVVDMLIEGTHTRQEILDAVKIPKGSRAKSAQGPLGVWLSTSDRTPPEVKRPTMAAHMGHVILRDDKGRLLLVQVREASKHVRDRVARLGGYTKVGLNAEKVTSAHKPIGGLIDHPIPAPKPKTSTMPERGAEIQRKTKETQVEVSLDLGGTGEYDIDTGVPFFDHMLSHVAKHGLLTLTLRAKGDIEVDFHHLVEDVGLVLGEALAQAVGDKRGMVRYGHSVVPMDEACVMCALDFSGRPLLRYDIEVRTPKTGEFDTELGQVFFGAVAANAKMTLHLQQLAGSNSHHLLEAAFKAFGRALDQGTQLDPRRRDVPSTKGQL